VREQVLELVVLQLHEGEPRLLGRRRAGQVLQVDLALDRADHARDDARPLLLLELERLPLELLQLRDRAERVALAAVGVALGEDGAVDALEECAEHALTLPANTSACEVRWS